MDPHLPSGRQPAAKRALLILILILFIIGRLWAHLHRPTPDASASALYGLPDPRPCFVDATALERGTTRIFISGTTVAQALSFLGVQGNTRGSGFCIPRAAKLVRTPDGWSMEPMSQSERWIWGIPMDLNRCSRKDILLIPGIGPATAALIHGYLLDRVWVASIAELDGIRGLGPRRMEAVRRYLEVEGEQPSCPGKGPDSGGTRPEA